jgi:hypothetical protein
MNSSTPGLGMSTFQYPNSYIILDRIRNHREVNTSLFNPIRRPAGPPIAPAGEAEGTSDFQQKHTKRRILQTYTLHIYTVSAHHDKVLQLSAVIFSMIAYFLSRNNRVSHT